MDNRKMIYLDDAIDALADYIHLVDKVIGTGHLSAEDCKDAATSVLEDLPSAQPEERALHESCTDCPLYDHERHSCPRFNKVIPETLREVQSDKRLEKIADLVEGTIDHFDKDDAMDLLYQIKEVLNEK